MRPITFSCTDTVTLAPVDISHQILDLAMWSEFKGYGVLPGIKSVEFEVRTPGIVGTRFRVTGTDGSRHIEEIVQWEPDRRVRLEMKDFSPPLSVLASRFEEVWEFERLGDTTQVVRFFRLFAKSTFTWPLLWLISVLLKKAITRHLQDIRQRSDHERVIPITGESDDHS